MSEKREGTVVLDGLIEGRVPETGDAASRVREWIHFAASLSLPFSLEIDGGAFSILAGNKPIAAEALGPRPADRIAEALGQLLTAFPEGERPRVFSTLRSVEYASGVEIQTLYTVAADGTVAQRERTVDARTTPPPEPLSRRDRTRLVLVGLLAAVVILGVSTLFVPYGKLWDQIVNSVVPVRVSDLKIDVARFATCFTVTKTEVRGRRTLVLTLTRGPAYPRDDAGLRRLLDAAKDSIPKRLAAEAIARGYVRCEYFDRRDEFLGFTFERVAPLQSRPTVQIELPLPRDRRLARVVLTY